MKLVPKDIFTMEINIKKHETQDSKSIRLKLEGWTIGYQFFVCVTYVYTHTAYKINMARD